MKRIVIGTPAALITFSLGVALSSLWLLYTPQPLKIIREGTGCGPDGSSHFAELSDGTSISNSCWRYASPGLAASELQKRLSHATEIIERTPNLDYGGRIAGERVVATGSGVLVLSTFGDVFCSTEAASFKHLQWHQRR